MRCSAGSRRSCARGDSAHVAGLVVAVSILAQVGAALPAPLIAVRLRRQGGLAAAVVGLITASMLGLIRGPLGWQWALAVALGIGMGAVFALAITLIVLRSPDADTAARLSGMAQSVGYSLASLGPLAIGVWHGRTGDWHGAEALFLVAGAGAAISGALAGRPLLVGTRPASNRHARDRVAGRAGSHGGGQGGGQAGSRARPGPT